MAAILCSGIGKACQGCCNCIKETCLLPFKACGACYEGLGKCCSESCKFVMTCCSSSFCCYITIACALNIPPIVLGIIHMISDGGVQNFADCHGSLWLLIFWLISIIHVVAAFYMAYAVEHNDELLPSRGGDEESGFDRIHDGADRMKHLFCYDYWMAGYILVVLAYFGWLILGGIWWVTMEQTEQCDGIRGTMAIAYGFGWAFVFLGGCGLCCSMCCGVFLGGTRKSDLQQYPSVTNHQPPVPLQLSQEQERQHHSSKIEHVDPVAQVGTEVDEKNSFAGPSRSEVKGDPSVTDLPVATAVPY